MPSFYCNEYLFSEIYLEEITHQTEPLEVLASLNVLREYREYADTHSLKAWKESYVHEVLSALGFSTRSKSDHLIYLFPMGSLEKPVSLCYVVMPEENLDNTTIGRNWAEKIIRSLREHNHQWGLLTNGKQWRIYHLDEPTPYESYLEIDLEAILREKAKDAYQIFHKFLKADNFTVRKDGKCLFDRFKQESQGLIDYIEKELANALKQREEGGKGVLSDICMGYVEELHNRQEGDLDDEAWRKKIYHGAMLYMFRLLFLFYADARQLLSDDNHALLEAVGQDCRNQRSGQTSGVNSNSIWMRLDQIFVDIDQTYNGGLFSPQESEFTRFIEDTRIGDAYLANVIFNLTTYREKTGQEKPISYRDMSVRHLGTLYEGLLEHKLFIAKEDTEVRVAKGKILFSPASQGGKLITGNYLKAGTVYFAGDPSERKSSGSYFTPEKVVDYIVVNTVGEKLNELKETIHKKEEANREAFFLTVDEGEREALAALLVENYLIFVRERVLQLSVLDPAMGSGHFLVNATNLIANFITDLLNELGVEGALSSGSVYWRRWVVENCIYGVDLNPLAVELAKLSLWILSMARDQPLSFLNHHLKCGNSLVGARLEEIGNHPFSTSKNEVRQLKLFERDLGFKAAVEQAIAKTQLIASLGSTVRYEVEEKKAWLDEMEEILADYKAICSVHTSLYFDNEKVDEENYRKIVFNKDFLLANSLVKHDKYFHWELEFPGIFLCAGNGFDVVIGNPPWGRNLDIKKLTRFKLYQNIVDEDSSELFILLGMSLLKTLGVEGEVLPDTLLNPSKEKIRRFIISKFHLRGLWNIGPDWFSSEVRMSTLLWVCVNEHIVGKAYDVGNLILSDDLRRKCISGDIQISNAVKQYGQLIPSSEILNHEGALIKTFTGTEDINILEKIRSNSVTLGKLTERGRGVELNKDGLVVKCSYCHKWNSPPKMNQHGSFGVKFCQHCGKQILIDTPADNIRYLVSDDPSTISISSRRFYIDGDQIGRYADRTYRYIDISADGINYKSDTLYQSPKILLRQAGVGIKALYDDKQCYCPQSVYVYRIRSEFKEKGINEVITLGILLSRTFHYFLFKEFGEIDSAKAFVKLTHTRIEGLPFPNIDRFDKARIEKLNSLVVDLDGGKLDKCSGPQKLDT